jgi:hypothetical protein
VELQQPSSAPVGTNAIQQRVDFLDGGTSTFGSDLEHASDVSWQFSFQQIGDVGLVQRFRGNPLRGKPSDKLVDGGDFCDVSIRDLRKFFV